MSKILIVVDMQNDFVTGALRNEDAIKIVPNVVEKVSKAVKDKDCEVIFTYDTHDTDYLETEEGANLPVEHCINLSEGWKLIPELRDLSAGERFFRKDTFGSMDLAEYLRIGITNVKSIELIGLCTDICVISNAVAAKMAQPNVPIYVDAACCAGVSPESHDTALAAMKAIHVHVLNEGNEPWRN